MTSVERLYELYNVISDAKESGSKNEAEYKEILSGVKGKAPERRLSSQFIARFFSIFPNQQDQALNAVFDLCEDDDISIRKQAIKDLPSFCKVKPDIIPKVSDILAQLLMMEDTGEIAVIESSLISITKQDPKGTLTGLFYQIENNDDEMVRERSMKFIQEKLNSLGPEIFKADSEELIMKEAKTVLQDASEEDFLSMMAILKELKCTKTLKGYQQMVDLVAEQCGIEQSLDASDVESVHRLSSCLRQALPYFSSQIRSTKFVEYLFREVMPFLGDIDSNAGSTEPSSSSLVLDLLKTSAELTYYADNLEKTEEKVKVMFALLLEDMPLPPKDVVSSDDAAEGFSFDFSRVECLLYLFHRLAKLHPEFLADDADRLKDFRTRLQYFARGSHAYQKKLRESVSGKKGDELKTEDTRIKMIALMTTANINTLIKDLFHQPPSYKSILTLSWKNTGKGAEKRHAQITFDGNPNKIQRTERSDRAIYAPPRDKYSRGAGHFVRGQGMGRGRGRGFRGVRRF